MDLKPWVDEKFEVQFAELHQLPRIVTSFGFVNRAYGVSNGAAELFGKARERDDYRRPTKNGG